MRTRLDLLLDGVSAGLSLSLLLTLWWLHLKHEVGTSAQWIGFGITTAVVVFGVAYKAFQVHKLERDRG